MGGEELAPFRKRPRIPPGLPTELPGGDQGYALYEGIDYTEYWADPQQARQDALEQRLIAGLLPATGRRIIDVGGGYGRLSPCYVDRFDTVVLFDGSMSLLEKARETIDPRVTLVAGDVMRLPFRPSAFDAALSSRVLHHLPDIEGALSELGRIVARDGRLVFSYHNKRNARRVFTYLAGRPIPSPFSLDCAEVSPALISRHPRRMAELLGMSGFGEPDYLGAVAIDGLERFAERLGARQPVGLRAAGFLGRHRLAPWLVGRTTAVSGEPLVEASSPEELFECPACRGALTHAHASFTCGSCGSGYPVTRGIADFRV